MTADAPRDPDQRHFHLVMVLLLVVSCGLDQQDLAGWRAGRVSMVTLGLAMVWMGRYAMDGFRRRDALARMLGNRVGELEQRVDELERGEKARRGPFRQ